MELYVRWGTFDSNAVSRGPKPSLAAAALGDQAGSDNEHGDERDPCDAHDRQRRSARVERERSDENRNQRGKPDVGELLVSSAATHGQDRA